MVVLQSTGYELKQPQVIPGGTVGPPSEFFHIMCVVDIGLTSSSLLRSLASSPRGACTYEASLVVRTELADVVISAFYP